MSREQNFFPPAGSKWKWEPKALNYSPWFCCLSDQVFRKENPDSRFLPGRMSINLTVDLIEGEYKWVVSVFRWKPQSEPERISGKCKTALEAVLEAERVGEAIYQELMPDWVRTALTHGWRAP